MIRFLRHVFTPNTQVSKQAAALLIAVWAVAALIFWVVQPSKLLPGPLEVLNAFQALFNNGLVENLLASLQLNIEAVLLSTVVSLGLAYLTCIPAFRPPVALIAKLRFLGLTGLTFFFGLYLAGHELKLGLLVFGMTVFFSTSMIAAIAAIPKEQFDHARTLGMGEWRVVWEVVVLGTIDEAFEILRQNAAISFVMLTMVEGLVRSEGGLGTMLLNENRHFKLEAVFALQLTILAIGLLQDYGLAWARKLVCPYADLGMERR